MVEKFILINGTCWSFRTVQITFRITRAVRPRGAAGKSDKVGQNEVGHAKVTYGIEDCLHGLLQ